MPDAVDHARLVTQLAELCRRSAGEALGRGLAAALGLGDARLPQRFSLGYGGRALADALPKSGAVRRALGELGLLDEEGGLVLAGRLVVPVADSRRRVLGLAVMSPDRSEALYPPDLRLDGLDLRPAPRTALLLVDGVRQALRLWAAGVPGVIALNPVAGDDALAAALAPLTPSAVYVDREARVLREALGRLGVSHQVVDRGSQITLDAVNRALEAARPADQRPTRAPRATGPESFSDLTARFLTHLRLKNQSPKTIRQETQGLRHLAAHMELRGLASVHDITHEALEDYKSWMAGARSRRGGTLTVGTARGRLFTALRFLAYLRRKGVLARDPGVHIVAPRRAPRKLVPFITEAEVLRVLALPDLSTVLGRRDRAIMETLYASGVRSDELLGLRLKDVDLVKKFVSVRLGKGLTDRKAPLTSSAVRHVAAYIERARPKLAKGLRPAGRLWRKKYRTGGDLLFLSAYGGPICQGWLTQLMKKYLLRAGITRPVPPVHTWRHSCATHLLEGGLDVRYVQATLGHHEIDSVRHYAAVTKGLLTKQVAKHHPRHVLGGPFRAFVAGGVRQDARA